MKTVISKENAIAILEGVVVQQTVAVKIMDLADSVPDKLFVETGKIARALFNISLDNASPDEEEEIMASFTEPVEYGKGTVRDKAEAIYRKLKYFQDLRTFK